LRREWKSIWNCIKGISKEEVWGGAQSCAPPLRWHAALVRSREDERFASTTKNRSGRYPLCGLITRAGGSCFGLLQYIRLIDAASALFRCLHCGFKSVAFFLDVAGLVALKSLPNGVPEHEPCIFKFFLLPRLVTRIKEFKIKESVVVRQTRVNAERN